MNTTNIIRAWKDEEYRLSLSDAERAHLLENPVGSLELTDAELEQVDGGRLIVKCHCIFFSFGISCGPVDEPLVQPGPVARLKP